MPAPRSTYRLQLHPGFDFDAAAGVSDYLAALGVSHMYASPYLQAAPGSTHGYDVVDPSRVNEELGGEEGHRRLCEALGRAGLGQVLDIVPNHMAITGPENRWWEDVLRNGPASAYASYFDVDWDPPESKLRDLVLMPILGDHYGRELEAGAIRVQHDGGDFCIRYHDHILPVAPRSLAGPLSQAARLDPDGPGSEALAELGFLARGYGRLPEPSAHLGPEAVAERQRDLDVLDRRLRTLARERAEVRDRIERVVAELNEDADALDDLLSVQNYRLAHWRIGGQELDYRRFFDITTLAALRIERPEVFQAVHGRVLDWLRGGVIDGVRIDHPDGLRRPAQYMRRLRRAAPDAWIVAEKILMPDEALPDWPIAGTTGYDALNDVGGLFVDPAGEAPLTDLWRELTGDARAFHDHAYEARKDVLRDVLAADLSRLANVFVQVCEGRRRYRDYSRRELREALAEVAAAFPVYRTYVTESGHASPTDRAVIGRAVRDAGTRRPDLDGELLSFLGAILVGDVGGDGDGDEARGLRMRFQQFTGPVAAKAEEDTAFYRYLRFAPLNDVGGDPGRWGLDVDGFHERCRQRARSWPEGMTALSTHDTKRSEDVRARLFVLSEVADRWAVEVAEWRRTNEAHWPSDLEPDPRMEYLLYQTAVGAWPIGVDRLEAYMEKAAREAKLRTSWTDPDPAFDTALCDFVRRVMDGPWAAKAERFASAITPPGRVVALAQKLVHITAPGVPDIYQGTELWDLSLVDPDNRRPVDFDERRRLLARLDEAIGPAAILEHMDSGLPKLWVVNRALRARAVHPAAFGRGGDYEPLAARGDAAHHVVGFVRGGKVAVVVPRLVVGLARAGGWRSTEVALPDGAWTNELTGERAGGGWRAVADLLARFPVALLTREGAE